MERKLLARWRDLVLAFLRRGKAEEDQRLIEIERRRIEEFAELYQRMQEFSALHQRMQREFSDRLLLASSLEQLASIRVLHHLRSAVSIAPVSATKEEREAYLNYLKTTLSGIGPRYLASPLRIGEWLPVGEEILDVEFEIDPTTPVAKLVRFLDSLDQQVQEHGGILALIRPMESPVKEPA